MIEIKLIKNKEKFQSVMITGHANMSEYGSDIVCSSVSTLGFTLANYLTEVLNFSPEDINLYAIENEDSSLISINIEDKSIIEDTRVQDGFKFFEIGVISLSNEYSEYVKLIYREV